MTDQPNQASFVIDRATLEAEVTRIVDAAATAGLAVRVLGSIGVAMHSPDAAGLLPGFARTYADIDFAAYRRDTKALTRILTTMGYRDDREVFVASEGGRSMFDDRIRHLHIDVFYDRLEFCHVIPLSERLETDTPTIPLAELLLSKLQIVKINEKDVIDIVLLILDHPLGRGDVDTIDVDRISALCAAEWGLWRTLTLNLAKVADLTQTYRQLDETQRALILSAVGTLKARIDAEPKPLAWRMRDRVGDRRQWWTDVDEVG